ncbi:hypothetical protein Acr_28g0002060 [Actinidia rufa]|uniref:Uncharacterized protein n=1 Tax=Actinidia rufa TaxID=165716 RepID=A0A7J0H972_9ERIC|nr:hypothetical protein Acr_28g0002060 [Actinidia rufa]
MTPIQWQTAVEVVVVDQLFVKVLRGSEVMWAFKARRADWSVERLVTTPIAMQAVRKCTNVTVTAERKDLEVMRKDLELNPKTWKSCAKTWNVIQVGSHVQRLLQPVWHPDLFPDLGVSRISGVGTDRGTSVRNHAVVRVVVNDHCALVRAETLRLAPNSSLRCLIPWLNLVMARDGSRRRALVMNFRARTRSPALSLRSSYRFWRNHRPLPCRRPEVHH